MNKYPIEKSSGHTPIPPSAEGPISQLAGYCQPAAAWRLLSSLPRQMRELKCYVVTPANVLIDDDGFVFHPLQNYETGSPFCPPEVVSGAKPDEQSGVWSLAATIFQLVMGRMMMNNRGGQVQRPRSKVPFMRSHDDWAPLSLLVQRCLHYQPSMRPSLADIEALARQQYDYWRQRESQPPAPKATTDATANRLPDSELWPEEMRSTRGLMA